MLVIDAARWAPSAHNRQPWRLVVVTNPAVKLQMAQAMAERLRRERLADGAKVAEIEADVQRSINRFKQPPVVIVVCMTTQSMDQYSDDRRNALERIMTIQSTAMAGQNMLLMAHSLGIGACWVCAPLFAGEQVVSILEIPADWEPQGAILLGQPAVAPESRSRLQLSEVLKWI